MVCGCAAHVEKVTYRDYTNRYRNNLWVRVNSGGSFFHPGPCSWFGFDHVNYSFSMATRAHEYTQEDMSVSVLSGPAGDESFHPKAAIVTITNLGPGVIAVSIRVDDDHVPKLINGAYKLRLREDTPNGKVYESK